MQRVSIHELKDSLRKIPDHQFTCEGVYAFLESNPVDPESIARYLHWSDKFYTRNLIFKDERFELMAICWRSGQVSKIHDHADQKCWMTVPIGKLLGQNFSIIEKDAGRGHCRLTATDKFEMSEFQCAKVELEEPVHQILNLSEFASDAVSLHIYSKPYAACNSYCIETDTFKEVPLCYTSIDGRLCDGVEL
jgi:cysteine dioxygenase